MALKGLSVEEKTPPEQTEREVELLMEIDFLSRKIDLLQKEIDRLHGVVGFARDFLIRSEP